MPRLASVRRRRHGRDRGAVARKPCVGTQILPVQVLRGRRYGGGGAVRGRRTFRGFLRARTPLEGWHRCRSGRVAVAAARPRKTARQPKGAKPAGATRPQERPLSHAGRVDDVSGRRLSAPPAADHKPLEAHRPHLPRDRPPGHRVRRRVRAEDVRGRGQDLLRGSAPTPGRHDARLDAGQRRLLSAGHLEKPLARRGGRREPPARDDRGIARARHASRLPARRPEPLPTGDGPGLDHLQPPAAGGDRAAERAGDLHAVAVR